MKVTVRADSVEIEGYVNAVGRDSRKLTDEYGYPFVEQIQPGAFGRAISVAANNDQEIMMLLDHNALHVLGGTKSNLELEEDSIGLHARANVTDPDTIKAAAEKRLRGWSFGFRMLGYDPGYRDGCDHRTVTELDLVEVSVIDDQMTPAYAGTSIHARADASEETIYTRTMDDNVEYVEENRAESAAKAAMASAENAVKLVSEVRAEAPDPDTEKKEPAEPEKPKDFPRYRNRVKLLELGC